MTQSHSIEERSDFEELMRRARDGDAEALQDVLEPHRVRLTAFVRVNGRGGPTKREDEEDHVQSFWRRVISDIDAFEGPNDFALRRWLLTAAQRMAMDKRKYHRSAKRDYAAEQSAVIASSVKPRDLLACLQDQPETPSRQAMVREQVERLEDAIAELPDQYRRALSLEFAGLDRSDIARELDQSEDAVKLLVCRARSRLISFIRRDD